MSPFPQYFFFFFLGGIDIFHSQKAYRYGSDSVAECLPIMPKALSLIHSTTKQTETIKHDINNKSKNAFNPL